MYLISYFSFYWLSVGIFIALILGGMCDIAAVRMDQIDDKVFPFMLLLTWIYVGAMYQVYSW